MRIAQRGAFGQPLVGHRRGPQRQRHQPVARIVLLRCPPAHHVTRAQVQRPHQFAKPELGMIFAGQRIVQMIGPDRVGQVEIIAGQDHRPLRQPRHRLHQHVRGPARPGRTRNDDRIGGRGLAPFLGQRFRQQPHPRGGVGAGLCALDRFDDCQEFQRPCPVIGMRRHIQIADRIETDPFAAHFVKYPGQTVRQIIQRGPRGDIGFGLDQGAHQRDQLQPAAHG